MQPKNVTVLVVDDDKDLREAIVYELKKNSFKTLEASNGLDAIRILQMFNVNLVISDIKMPGGDGVELLKNIGALRRQKPPFMFISGYGALKSAEALALGAKKFFTKPFDRKELIHEVSQILGSQNS